MAELDNWPESGNPLFGNWGRGPRAVDPDVVFLGTPVGVPCLYCEEPIRPGDVGEFMRCYLEHGAEITPVHRECLLLHVVGHTYGYCNCSDYQGLTQRQAALAVAKLVDSGAMPDFDRD